MGLVGKVGGCVPQVCAARGLRADPADVLDGCVCHRGHQVVSTRVAQHVPDKTGQDTRQGTARQGTGVHGRQRWMVQQLRHVSMWAPDLVASAMCAVQGAGISQCLHLLSGTTPPGPLASGAARLATPRRTQQGPGRPSWREARPRTVAEAWPSTRVRPGPHPWERARVARSHARVWEDDRFGGGHKRGPVEVDLLVFLRGQGRWPAAARSPPPHRRRHRVPFLRVGACQTKTRVKMIICGCVSAPPDIYSIHHGAWVRRGCPGQGSEEARKGGTTEPRGRPIRGLLCGPQHTWAGRLRDVPVYYRVCYGVHARQPIMAN